MAKKRSNKDTRSDVVDEPMFLPPFTATNLSSTQQAFLLRVVRFLVNVVTPGFADKARREGYTSDEHAAGWRLARTAGGETRPFEHWLSEQQLVDGIGSDDAEQQQRLSEIDRIENRWFPRTRAIIRRAVPKDRREAFAAAFFKDLKQQPLGPGVVASVTTFVTRVEGLESSTDPDAKNVRAMLERRGLTRGKLTEIGELLDRARAGVRGSRPKTAVSAADLEQARQAQLQALEDLRDWFNDWGTTLRDVLGPSEQIRLGLTTAATGGTTAIEPTEAQPEDTAEEDEEREEAPATDADDPAEPA